MRSLIELLFYFFVFDVSFFSILILGYVNFVQDIVIVPTFRIGLIFIIFLIVIIEIFFIFYQHRINTSFLRKYSVNDFKTAKKIYVGSFSSLKEYQEGLELGAKNKNQLDLVKKYGVKTVDLANEILHYGFPDYSTYLEAKELGAKNYSQFKKTKKYEFESYEDVLVLEKGKFPNKELFIQAKELNISNYDDLILFKKYNSVDKDYCKSKHLTEISSLINELPEKLGEWRYSDIYDQFLNNVITKILYSKKYSILDDLFDNDLINGQLNRKNYSITLNGPFLDAKIIILEFFDNIKENIPITIDRFAEKTSLEKKQLETILPILIDNGTLFGLYLDLEGVFIKKIKSISGNSSDLYNSLIWWIISVLITLSIEIFAILSFNAMLGLIGGLVGLFSFILLIFLIGDIIDKIEKIEKKK
ncbi:MAG: hypothetical protein HeimC3_35720 [Candidatus Heimdallarchaeota archaeon LC_3]|nr:MAG: hypothetical protein HeimC3_35720 [Candidatus Heimdallarchaeota archaeon LC_3]